MTEHHIESFGAIVESLTQSQLGVFRNLLPPRLVNDLYQELLEMNQQQQLRPAAIGRGADRQQAREIRGDWIHWLDGASAAQREYLELMEALRITLNRELFLGLADLECHFAHYAPGTGYQRHLDSFRNNNRRRITLVCYLNPDWSPDDGGDLVIDDGEQDLLRVPPVGGTAVCFVSDAIPHRVEPTQRSRASIAGWFRVRE